MTTQPPATAAATLADADSAAAPTRYAMHKTRVAMGDGRTLNYYDFAPEGENPPHLDAHQSAASANPAGGPRALAVPPEMRWNPTLGEWTVFAPNRMSRVQLPSKDSCPLCPGVLELPLPYQVAIFENRSPSMAFVPPETVFPEEDSTDFAQRRAPARGRCDIVVYSPRHEGKMAEMSGEEIYCLIEAWRDRYAELIALPEIEAVTIFENKGRDAGMTLDHPHGQIYAFPFLPPLLQKQWEFSLADTSSTSPSTSGAPDNWQAILDKEERDEVRIIAQTPGFLAAMPYYARYPFEVHIWARRAGVSSLVEMKPQERRELAAILGHVTRRYENVFPGSPFGFPTLMLMQQMSPLSGRAHAEKFRFHIEFLPLQRAADKLKFRASVESGAGTFLNDSLPEAQAALLRQAPPHDLTLPNIVF
jgi:UDPglucose--hexose-1-phosphate uridylyltransferase